MGFCQDEKVIFRYIFTLKLIIVIKGVVILEKEFDYAALMDEICRLDERFSFLQFSYLTESAMGRGVPMLSLGEGEKQIYYVGAHHGAERITSAVLIRFADELCTIVEKGGLAFGKDFEFVLKTRKIRIIPMLTAS